MAKHQLAYLTKVVSDSLTGYKTALGSSDTNVRGTPTTFYSLPQTTMIVPMDRSPGKNGQKGKGNTSPSVLQSQAVVNGIRASGSPSQAFWMTSSWQPRATSGAVNPVAVDRLVLKYKQPLDVTLNQGDSSTVVTIDGVGFALTITRHPSVPLARATEAYHLFLASLMDPTQVANFVLTGEGLTGA